jgi:hypothetical protein
LYETVFCVGYAPLCVIRFANEWKEMEMERDERRKSVIAPPTKYCAIFSRRSNKARRGRLAAAAVLTLALVFALPFGAGGISANATVAPQEFGIEMSPDEDVYVAIPEGSASPFRVATFAITNNGDRDWHALWLDLPLSEYFYLIVDGQESVPCVVGNLLIAGTRTFELWASGVPPEYDIYGNLKSSDGYPLAPVAIHFVEGEARYGGVNYARFGDAYGDANAEGEADPDSVQTITLLKDVAYGDPIVAYGYDLSIDLSGHDLNVDCDTNDAVIAALGGGSVGYTGAGEFNVNDTYNTYDDEDQAGENRPILVKGGGSVEVTNVSGGAITVSDPNSSLTVHGDIAVNGEMVPNEVTDIMVGEAAQMTVGGGIYGGRNIYLYDSPMTVGGDVEGRIEAHGQTDVTIGGDVTGTEAGGVLYDYGSRGLVTIEGSLTVPDGAPYIVMNGSQNGDYVTVPKGPDDYDSVDEDGYKIYSETWQSGTSSIVRIHNVETQDDPPGDDTDPPDDSTTEDAITVNRPPVVVTGQAYQTGTARPASADGSVEATVYNGNLSNWFADPDGDALSYQVISVTPQAAGNIGISPASGSFAYAPSAGVAGKAVTIVVKANDGQYDSTGNVTLTVSVGTVPSGTRSGGSDNSADGKKTTAVPSGKSAATKLTIPKMKIKKVTAGRKFATVTFKKVAGKLKVTKYQVQYRVKGTKKWKTKNFTLKYTGKSAAKISVKKLKKGKRYQFRIRAWKKVGGKKYYAPWSKTVISRKIG